MIQIQKRAIFLGLLFEIGKLSTAFHTPWLGFLMWSGTQNIMWTTLKHSLTVFWFRGIPCLLQRYGQPFTSQWPAVSTTQLLWLSGNYFKGTQWPSCSEHGDEAGSGGENKRPSDTNPVFVLEQFSCTEKSQHWRSSVAIWKPRLYYWCLRKFPCSRSPNTGHAYINIFPFSVYVWIETIPAEMLPRHSILISDRSNQSWLSLKWTIMKFKLKRGWGACCGFELKFLLHLDFFFISVIDWIVEN